MQNHPGRASHSPKLNISTLFNSTHLSVKTTSKFFNLQLGKWQKNPPKPRKMQMPPTHQPRFPQSTTSTQSPTFQHQNQCFPPTTLYPNPTWTPRCQKSLYVPLPPLPPPLSQSRSPDRKFKAPTAANEPRSYPTNAHSRCPTHRNAHPARQWYYYSRGRTADAVKSGKSWGAGEAVSE